MLRSKLQQSGQGQHALWPLGLLLCVCLNARAERLPLKTYTTADGLAHNVINRVVRDSRGFLWFCTEEGLARFDGYQFISYGTGEGLPHSGVNDLLETRAGDFWIATNAGLVRFDPRGAPTERAVYADEAPPGGRPPMFTTFVPADEDRHARTFTALAEGRDGTIWCGTLKGVYRLDARGGRLALTQADVGMPSEFAEQRYVNALIEDSFGSLWVAAPSGLYRRWAAGAPARYTRREGLPGDFLHALLLDHRGQLWAGTRDVGFFRLGFDGTHAPPTVALTITPRDFEQSGWVNQLLETSDHKLWAATARGLLEYLPDGAGGGPHYRLYTTKNGLSDHNVASLGEDAGGNLWLGSATGTGAMKLARSGFVTYGEQDGVNSVYAVFADRAGGVCLRGYVLGDRRASVFDGGQLDLLNLSQATYWPRLGRFDGRRLEWFVPEAMSARDFGWVGEGVTLQSRRSGEWWVVSGRQLFRFPPAESFAGIRHARPLSVFGEGSVLGGRQIFRLFEDSRGRVWVSTIASEGNGLALWEPETQSLRDLTGAANLPSLRDTLARSFGEDGAGGVWLGFSTGAARYSDGGFTFYGARKGLPPGAIMDIYADRAGRLWLASARSGLVRVDDPGAARPTFTSYTTAQGLSGNVVSAVAEDAYGRVYAGTGRGLDRLDPATGRVRHYTTADGLAGGKIYSAFGAPDGSLWIGTAQGLSRFRPEAERQTPAPPVLLTALGVAGAAQRVSALGETEMRLPDLPAGAGQLQIDFVGLGFAPGESLRYQYMLEGADAAWSAPSAQRTVTYARLAPGRYRFLVRAVNADGRASEAPASVTFRVLPPLWARWWFVSLAALASACAAYVLYRYRVARILQVADMRTRIATDLHDDIGANLTRIAVLSEVAKQRFGGGGDGRVENPLSSIADIARESVASMGDIVWAINPERDSLRDLVRRMRRHADEVFTLRDIALEFDAPGAEQNPRLGAGVRRDVLLIFKEAVNNAVRHARCTRVRVELRADDAWLALTVADDGAGFDTGAAAEGHGLMSMRQRARRLGGALEVESAAGRGTTVRLRVPRARASPV